MILQLQPKTNEKALKEEMESIWQKLNDLRICFYYLKNHEEAIYEAKQFVDQFNEDKRLRKISIALEDLEEWVDLECFEDMEEATEKVLVEIDEEFFGGALFEKFMEEDDEE